MIFFDPIPARLSSGGFIENIATHPARLFDRFQTSKASTGYSLATSRRKIDAFSIVVNGAWQRKTRRGNRRGVPRSMCRVIKGRLAFPWRDRC